MNAEKRAFPKVQFRGQPTSAPIAADAYLFELRRDAGRNLMVEVIGVLERNEDTTLVSGTGRFSRVTIDLPVPTA